jgi:hypothetical protein
MNKDRMDLLNSPSPETGEEGPVITLPTDREWVDVLQLKFEEYGQRIKKNSPDLVTYFPPDIVMSSAVSQENYRLIGTIYKERILGQLLKTGSLNTHEIGREFADQDGILFTKQFINACAVVDQYTRDFSLLASRVKSS